MSGQNKLGLTVFEVALFLAVLAIGWAVLRAFRFARQVDQIPVTFRDMPDQYFRVAAQQRRRVPLRMFRRPFRDSSSETPGFSSAA